MGGFLIYVQAIELLFGFRCVALLYFSNSILLIAPLFTNKLFFKIFFQLKLKRSLIHLHLNLIENFLKCPN
jgi:hypothetical protein